METRNLNIQLVDLREGILRYISSLNLDSDEGTMVQETFLKAILSRPRSNMDQYVKGWTENIRMKAFINNYRRILMQSPANNNVFKEDLFLMYRPDSDQKTLYNSILNDINRLDQKFVKPLTMYVEGYSYKEIADAMNIKVETVKTRIFMARSLLMIQK